MPLNDLEHERSARPVPSDRSTDQGWRQHLEQLDVEDLRALLDSLPMIEQAKGVLMGFYGCDAAAAFSILRRWSSTRNVKLRILAEAVVAAAGRPTSEPYAVLNEFLRSANLR